MQGFQRILYVERHLRGSGRGLACAVDLARSHGARLTVAALAGRGVPEAPMGADAAAAARQEADRDLQAALDRLADAAGLGRPAYDVRVLHGEAVPAIVAAAADHDLVMKVVEDTPRSWVREGLDERLVHTAPCPVWLLEPAQRPGLRVVLVALAADPDAPAAAEVEVARIAAEVAQRAGAELRAVHAWDVVGEPLLSSHLTGPRRRRLQRLLGEARRRHRLRAERLLARAAPGRDIPLELGRGGAGRVVRTAACEAEADLVVMGATPRRGWSRLLMRDVPSVLIGRLPSALLVVPPGARRPDPGAAAPQTAGAEA